MTNLFCTKILYSHSLRPNESRETTKIFIQLAGKKYMKKKRQMPKKLNKSNKNNVVNAKSNDCKRSYRVISRLVDVVSEFAMVSDT